MKLKIDDLDADKFGRLNNYISQESNVRRGDDGSSKGLKVVIEEIEKTGPAYGGQTYEGIKIHVEDFALTKQELYELMDLVCYYKDSELKGLEGE